MKAKTADVMLLVGLAGLAMSVGRVNLAAGVMVGSVLALAWIRGVRELGKLKQRGFSNQLLIFLKSVAVATAIMIPATIVAIAVGAFFFADGHSHFFIKFDFKRILGICVAALSSMPVTSFLVRKLW